jgi:diacylglycerol O-acyltransferase
MNQLSPQDAQFLYMESEQNLTHVTSVSVYDPTTVPGGKVVRFKDIIGHVESRLHVSPIFKRKLVRVPFELDYPYWVDDDYFDLEYHIRHGRLPEPGDWRQFCIHLARYHSRPLDMKRPPWEMFVIEGLDYIEGMPKGSYAIATKIHHAAGDGTALTRFFGAMSDIDNRGTPAMPMKESEAISNPEPSAADIARRAFQNTLRSPVRVTETILRAAPGLVRAAQDALRSRDDDKSGVPDTRFNGEVSPHKMFDATTFALDDLKAIRKGAPGCTINDVVLALCSSALRAYLQYHDELPDESLVAWVPINARPKNSSEKEAPGNNISAMTTRIFTDVADPIDRLCAIRDATKQSKEAKSGVSARLMTDLTQNVPAATQVMAARLVLRTGLAARVCNLFVSNVPGPQEPLYMNGAQAVQTYGMAPLGDGMGLFIATPSYNGTMPFSVTSTREIMPDIRYFIGCLDAAMAELKRASAEVAKSGHSGPGASDTQSSAHGGA